MPPDIKVSLLTGGPDDPTYAVPLATALAGADVSVDFIGNDAMQACNSLERTRIQYLNLRGSQDPAAPMSAKICRVLRYYRNLCAYAHRTDSKLFHMLWLNKFEMFDRTILNIFYRLKHKKLILTAHNVNTRKRDGNDSAANRMTLRAMYSMLDHVFVHTDLCKEELLGEYRVPAQKVSVIPHGLNTYVPDTALSKAESRARLGLASDEKVLLFFGQIAPYKGLDILVEALKVSGSRHANPTLIIAGKAKRGSGSYWPRLKAKVEEGQCPSRIVIRDGFVQDCDVAVLFKAADALVLPYRAIYQSGPLSLAYRFGVPVIATRVGSFDRDVISGVTGVLSSPEDPGDLARAICSYFSSDLYLKADVTRERIRQIGRERYSWERIAQTIRSVYSQLLNTRAA
jgi:D-inositol-3-phosphate glycosyltransferase